MSPDPMLEADIRAFLVLATNGTALKGSAALLARLDAEFARRHLAAFVAAEGPAHHEVPYLQREVARRAAAVAQRLDTARADESAPELRGELTRIKWDHMGIQWEVEQHGSASGWG